MANESKSLKPILYALILFAVVGISLATETMTRFGLQDNYIYVVSAALLFVALMLGKKPVLVLIVLLGVMAINLPDTLIDSYGIDRDMLLAVVCAVILAPTLFDLISE